jgi:hypothetical protein
MKKTLFILMLLGLSQLTLLLFSACAHENLDNSKIPWARPAPYEGGIPGFGGGSGYGN